MNIKIFTAHLPAGDYSLTAAQIDSMQSSQIEDIEKKVNAILTEHQGATVEWHQSTAASRRGNFVQLTAIVSYRKL